MMEAFIGTEIEGCWKGIPTLFITTQYLVSHTAGEILATMDKAKVRHLYIGARDTLVRKDDWEAVRRFISNSDNAAGLSITVETTPDTLADVPLLAIHACGTRFRIIARLPNMLPADINIELKAFSVSTDEAFLFTKTQVVDIRYCKDMDLT